MKTGIELIYTERKEQINKHGFSLDGDTEFYKKGELFQAASFCLELKCINGEAPATMLFRWPHGWDKYFEQKIRAKSRIGQLVVAGAFLMAENDRLKSLVHMDTIGNVAAEIDFLQNSPMNNDKDSKPMNCECGDADQTCLYPNCFAYEGLNKSEPKIEPVEPEKQDSSFTEWLKSEEGRTCAQGTATGKYLENRLWWAYHAGQENAPSLKVSQDQIDAVRSSMKRMTFFNQQERSDLRGLQSVLTLLESILTNQK